MKIIETLWFSSMYGFIGIVLGEDAISGERKAYIGPHRGQDEKVDQEFIASGGAKFTRAHAEQLLAHFKKEEVDHD